MSSKKIDDDGHFFSDKDDELVTCSNKHCSIRQYHRSCAENYSPDNKWFCSIGCTEEGICWCRVDKGGDILECAAGENCTGNMLYHRECINQDGGNIPVF